MDDDDAVLIRLLSIPPQQRTSSDIGRLHAHFRNIEGLFGSGIVSGPTSAHRDAQLRLICQLARHRRVPGDVMLYQTGDLTDAWFVLLTGSVLIETSMFLPRACFGTRVNGSAYRPNDCLVLEPSDLIVIPYTDRDRNQVVLNNTHRQAVTQHKRRLSFDAPSTDRPNTVYPNDTVHNMPPSTARHVPGRLSSPTTTTTTNTCPTEHSRMIEAKQSYPPLLARQSQVSSDTSSAQSQATGGDTCSDSGKASSLVSSDRREMGKAKLSHGTADNSFGVSEDEDEDDFESSSHESLRDAFWESILKEPRDRTEDDIQMLMENVQQLPAFSNLTKTTCRALCSVMVVAMVHEAGQVVLGDNEPLDTWSVVLNGTVEVVDPDSTTVRELTRGDSFGVRYGRSEATHRGIMRTLTEDCQFVCVPQADYMRIMSREGEAEIPEMGEGGRIVLVYEEVEAEGPAVNGEATAKLPNTEASKSKKTRLVTKGTPEKLIEHLVADLSNADITYPEDFLLTYRTFLDSPRSIVVRLLSWHMHNPKLRPRVNRIILLWVHNHFNDFEDSPEMMKFVENFDHILAADGTAGERRLFQLACSTKARPRQLEFDLPVCQTIKCHPPSCPAAALTGTTTTFTVQIPFTLIGGHDGFGIFIDQVDPHFATALETGSWNPAGKSNSESPSLAKSHMRRADQLLSVNGRSVDQMTPAEVLHWIQSLGSVVVEQNKSPSTDRATLVCPFSFLLVYNPVQYHQLVSSSNGKPPANIPPVPSPRKVSNGGSSRSVTGQSQAISKKLKLPNIGGASRSQRPTAEPIRNGWSRPGRCSSKEPFGGTRVLQSPDGHVSANRPHSAHSSPARSDGTRSTACVRTNGPLPRTCVSPSNDKYRRSPSSSRLAVVDPQRALNRTKRSSSQPDLSISGVQSSEPGVVFRRPSDSLYLSEASVIRVWRSSDFGREQSSKLVLLPRRQTNALDASRLAAYEFGITEEDTDAYSLYHVTVEPGPHVKQCRLANTTDDLAGRLALNARYYLKHNRNHEPLVPDEVAKTILTESRVSFLQLVPEDLAIQLTLDDYEVFRAVQSTEYINEVFGLIQNPPESTNHACMPVGYATGHDNLDRFTELVNREAYWVPTEVCQEANLSRRVDLLKRFIKLAKFCRDLRNYNTMFCILVGLHQTAVERLKQTWERLPNKYHKMYNDLSMVLDTSRNFSHYRSLLTNSGATTAPMLPYLPLVLKDLTFIHLGNPSRSPEGLVNFVKLRMIAKEIRAIGRMCNVNYDLATAQRLLRRPMSGRSRTSKASVLASAKPSINVASGWVVDSPANSAFIIDELKRQELELEGEQQQHPDGIRGKRSLPISFNHNGPTTNLHTVTTSQLNLLPGRRRSGNAATGFLFGSASGINPKKIYESWLVILRIRTYLANLVVNSDPESLAQLSARIEPGTKGSAQINATTASSSTTESTVSLASPPSKESAKTPQPSTAISPSPLPSDKPPTCTNTPTPSSVQSNPVSQFRPILGAQTVEDARKLLALSECHRRSQHRLPAFTFPSATRTTSPNSTRFVLFAPSPSPHIAQPWQNGRACQNFANLQPPASSYALMGANSMMLDSLIPMPQRIGSLMRHQSAAAAAAAMSQRCTVIPSRVNPAQSAARNWIFTSTADSATGCMHVRPRSSPHSRSPQNPTSSTPPRFPHPMGNVPPGYALYSQQQRSNNHPSMEDRYRYPAANMHPLGVPNCKLVGARRIGPQSIEWKPNQPPPYELALALRQQQSSISGNGHAGTEQTQNRSSVGPPSASQRQILITRGFSADGPRRVSPADLSRMQHSRSIQSQHPPGAPRNAQCQSSSPQFSPSDPSKVHQRPTPPSYQQVVGLARQRQPIANNNNPATTRSDRPIPPARSQASSRAASSTPDVVILRPNELADKQSTDPRRR